jgi:hypothetical protein
VLPSWSAWSFGTLSLHSCCPKQSSVTTRHRSSANVVLQFCIAVYCQASAVRSLSHTLMCLNIVQQISVILLGIILWQKHSYFHFFQSKGELCYNINSLTNHISSHAFICFLFLHSLALFRDILMMKTVSSVAY